MDKNISLMFIKYKIILYYHLNLNLNYFKIIIFKSQQIYYIL